MSKSVTRTFWSILLIAFGYALGASGIVPEIWHWLREPPHEAVAQEANAPEVSEPDGSSTAGYSYQRPPADQLVEARVVKITDGDTFRAMVGNREVKYRMADYDSPERDQPYGTEAAKELSTLIAGKSVQVEERGSGGFGRIAARAFIGSLDVNYEMVRRGAGWFDPEYAQDEELYVVESAARDAKIGLWALPPEKRIEPWVWRGMPKELKALRR